MNFGMKLCVLLLFHLDISHCTDEGNIALRKPANQTGVFAGMTADLAVDGRVDSCAHPDADYFNQASWTVDLQDVYNIQTVTIINTDDYAGAMRLTEFSVCTGPTSDSITQCIPVHKDVVGRAGNVTLPVNLDGRFLRIRRESGNEIHLITLCEVQVYGSLIDVPPVLIDEMLSVVETTAHSVTLTWDPLRDLSTASVLSSIYQVLYTDGKSTPVIVQNINMLQDMDLPYEATVDGLSPNTRYDFIVRVKGPGFTLQYPGESATTLCTDPISPMEVSFVPSTSENGPASIFISYEETVSLDSTSGCDRITDVWINYKKSTDDVWSRDVIPVNTTQSTLEYTQYLPGTGVYLVNIVVQNNAGFVDSTGLNTVNVVGLPPLKNITTTEGGEVMKPVDNKYWYIIGTLCGIIFILLIVMIVVCQQGIRRARESSVGVGEYLTVPGMKNTEQRNNGHLVSVENGDVTKSDMRDIDMEVIVSGGVGEYITAPGLTPTTHSTRSSYIEGVGDMDIINEGLVSSSREPNTDDDDDDDNGQSDEDISKESKTVQEGTENDISGSVDVGGYITVPGMTHTIDSTRSSLKSSGEDKEFTDEGLSDSTHRNIDDGGHKHDSELDSVSKSTDENVLNNRTPMETDNPLMPHSTASEWNDSGYLTPTHTPNPDARYKDGYLVPVSTHTSTAGTTGHGQGYNSETELDDNNSRLVHNSISASDYGYEQPVVPNGDIVPSSAVPFSPRNADIQSPTSAGYEEIQDIPSTLDRGTEAQYQKLTGQTSHSYENDAVTGRYQQLKM